MCFDVRSLGWRMWAAMSRSRPSPSCSEPFWVHRLLVSAVLYQKALRNSYRNLFCNVLFQAFSSRAFSESLAPRWKSTTSRIRLREVGGQGVQAQRDAVSQQSWLGAVGVCWVPWPLCRARAKGLSAASV